MPDHKHGSKQTKTLHHFIVIELIFNGTNSKCFWIFALSVDFRRSIECGFKAWIKTHTRLQLPMRLWIMTMFLEWKCAYVCVCVFVAKICTTASLTRILTQTQTQTHIHSQTITNCLFFSHAGMIMSLKRLIRQWKCTQVHFIIWNFFRFKPNEVNVLLIRTLIWITYITMDSMMFD